MKNYDEYMQNIRAKAQKLKTRRRIAFSCAAALVLVLALTLFVPYNDQLPSVVKYQNSPYYMLINGINKATWQPPAHKNNYQWLKDAITGMPKALFAPTMDFANGAVSAFDAVVPVPEAGIASGSNQQKYEEVTDNQVQGVIEGDLFKRSDKYIYYLRGTKLTVYTIDKENSAEVGATHVFGHETASSDSLRYFRNTHMYLSEDCTTLTVVGEGYSSQIGSFTVLTALDVSDPANITAAEPIYFAGNLISSRMVDGDMLLIYNYRLSSDIDFDKPETFVPIYGSLENMQPIGADDIYCPAEDPTSARYTVIAKLDGKTLQVQDTAALLSYSQQVYVSQNTIYATYGYTCTVAEESVGGMITQTALTEITGISYRGDGLDILGTATVDGSVKDQYSMDEYNGILRVATSTSVLTRQVGSDQNTSWVQTVDRKNNCNLYCIDLSSWEVAASVIGFAPDGEEVTSARFDGPMGYVCTAEVIIMTDPVYFFDLSDMENITYKHTPIIDGYSSSLINFGDYLLGIGINDEREMKVEIYEETADGVEPVASFELPCTASPEYKSYYIDRENNLVGIPICLWSNGELYYLLLHYDGYEIYNLLDVQISSKVDTVRADIIDGWLYLLEDDLQVVKVW